MPGFNGLNIGREGGTIWIQAGIGCEVAVWIYGKSMVCRDVWVRAVAIGLGCWDPMLARIGRETGREVRVIAIGL